MFNLADIRCIFVLFVSFGYASSAFDVAQQLVAVNKAESGNPRPSTQLRTIQNHKRQHTKSARRIALLALTNARTTCHYLGLQFFQLFNL